MVSKSSPTCSRSRASRTSRLPGRDRDRPRSFHCVSISRRASSKRPSWPSRLSNWLRRSASSGQGRRSALGEDPLGCGELSQPDGHPGALQGDAAGQGRRFGRPRPGGQRLFGSVACQLATAQVKGDFAVDPAIAPPVERGDAGRTREGPRPDRDGPDPTPTATDVRPGPERRDPQGPARPGARRSRSRESDVASPRSCPALEEGFRSASE